MHILILIFKTLVLLHQNPSVTFRNPQCLYTQTKFVVFQRSAGLQVCIIFCKSKRGGVAGVMTVVNRRNAGGGAGWRQTTDREGGGRRSYCSLIIPLPLNSHNPTQEFNLSFKDRINIFYPGIQPVPTPHWSIKKTRKISKYV